VKKKSVESCQQNGFSCRRNRWKDSLKQRTNLVLSHGHNLVLSHGHNLVPSHTLNLGQHHRGTSLGTYQSM
jgi:hypothetical protein